MKKESKEWFKIAFEDLKAAKCLYKEGLYRMVCYHSQQVVEKGLKAILNEHQIDFKKTHNIIDLMNKVISFGYDVKLSDEDVVFLNSIYRVRYPGDTGLLPYSEPDKDDANKALNIADNFLIIIKSIFT